MNKKYFILLVLFATTLLTTRFLVIPISIGYFNLSDIAVVFSGLLIAHMLGSNSWINLLLAALITGAGAALADVWAGYAFYAPATFVAKGLEAALAYISKNKKGVKHLLILLLGGILMVGTYFIFDLKFVGEEGGLKVALASLFPMNSLQLITGIVAGRLLFLVASKIIKAEE